MAPPRDHRGGTGLSAQLNSTAPMAVGLRRQQEAVVLERWPAAVSRRSRDAPSQSAELLQTRRPEFIDIKNSPCTGGEQQQENSVTNPSDHVACGESARGRRLVAGHAVHRGAEGTRRVERVVGPPARLNVRAARRPA
ncbi:hypothetical protein EYF80_053132 [Liparis tanakae]|uniref:Uncharacterized protein n=1 Tax=Liparis tanakae TaxID=230148 RepID=A0A4Z2F6A3_9TELE|nr:hypothetical protein EYF80_053132 [Liparis tanakae]